MTQKNESLTYSKQEILRQRRAHRRRRHRRRMLLGGLIACVLFSLLALALSTHFSGGPSDGHLHADAASDGTASDGTASESSFLDLSSLYSPYAILMDLSDGQILAAQNENDTIYPASLTKIMTVLLVIESDEDLDQTLYLPDDLFEQLYEEDASLAGFAPGEEVSLRSLLYGALLPSGAECCLAAAQYTCGSEADFVTQMNQKAHDLGMDGSHFTNCTGLPDGNHYSTAKDLALLLRYALQNEIFREIFTSRSYYAPPTWAHPEGFTFYSTLSETMEAFGLEDAAILGGKTGYTEAAGLCLASLGEVNGREYILVTAGAAGSHDTEPYHVLDAVRVYQMLSESAGL